MLNVKRLLIVVSVLTMLVLSLQITRAGECEDGNGDACWSRWYAGDSIGGVENRIYFRIFKACRDGMQVGLAANLVDSYKIYLKQYSNMQNPEWRLLTDLTTIPLDPVPGGVSIEMTGEGGSTFGGHETVYFMRIFNIGWSETFNPNYNILAIASPGYGYSENDSDGVVNSEELHNCLLFGHPLGISRLAPFAQCVIDGPGNTLTARFGYYNSTGYDTFIPKGLDNRIFATPSNLNVPAHLPTVLETGYHYNAVTVTQNTHGLTWKLGTATSTANLSSPGCSG